MYQPEKHLLNRDGVNQSTIYPNHRGDHPMTIATVDLPPADVNTISETIKFANAKVTNLADWAKAKLGNLVLFSEENFAPTYNQRLKIDKLPSSHIRYIAGTEGKGKFNIRQYAVAKLEPITILDEANRRPSKTWSNEGKLALPLLEKITKTNMFNQFTGFFDLPRVRVDLFAKPLDGEELADKYLLPTVLDRALRAPRFNRIVNLNIIGSSTFDPFSLVDPEFLKNHKGHVIEDRQNDTMSLLVTARRDELRRVIRYNDKLGVPFQPF